MPVIINTCRMLPNKMITFACGYVILIKACGSSDGQYGWLVRILY